MGPVSTAQPANSRCRRAGAAARDITPVGSVSLYGYPGVKRRSTGVHDALLASALYLDDGRHETVFVAVDLIWLAKRDVAEARRRIEAVVGIPAAHVMVTATHTHSGPTTLPMLSNRDDPTASAPSSAYVERVIGAIVEAVVAARDFAQPAELGFAVPSVSGLGTNRHDPQGPALPSVPVLIARSAATRATIGVMCVCSMHPTVLHEDSTLVSGDFPGCARVRLREKIPEFDAPLVYHMGAAGDQSPRHVVRSNSFAEAERLGEILAAGLAAAVRDADYVADWNVGCATASIDLPLRRFPPVQEAETTLHRAEAKFRDLKESDAPRTAVRTAECDWFGAQETMTLARAQQDGELQAAACTCLPAEIHRIDVGPWSMIGWPGEVFVDFARRLQQACPHAVLITLANGELQGYLVTDEAVAKQWYESGNAIFASPESGERMLAETIRLLKQPL